MVHELKKLPYAFNALKGISAKVVEWHHGKHHAGYVTKRNEIEEKLKSADKTSANANFSEYGELKRRETFNANGQVLHEYYWDSMGSDGNADAKLPIVKKIAEDFGSFDAWKNDFVAGAKTALGWTVMAYDPSDGKIHNYTGDTHNQGGVWGAVPLLPIDVFEHAYYHDYGPDRAKYIEAFLSNINWKQINTWYENIHGRGT
ncbi:superoxide dismutase [Candidatus Woesearchaeota archaeon]|nr:superoxide dismutase [Candidatus Woesearchaeota archaeon]